MVFKFHATIIFCIRRFAGLKVAPTSRILTHRRLFGLISMSKRTLLSLLWICKIWILFHTIIAILIVVVVIVKWLFLVVLLTKIEMVLWLGMVNWFLLFRGLWNSILIIHPISQVVSAIFTFHFTWLRTILLIRVSILLLLFIIHPIMSSFISMSRYRGQTLFPWVDI